MRVTCQASKHLGSRASVLLALWQTCLLICTREPLSSAGDGQDPLLRAVSRSGPQHTPLARRLSPLLRVHRSGCGLPPLACAPCSGGWGVGEAWTPWSRGHGVERVDVARCTLPEARAFSPGTFIGWLWRLQLFFDRVPEWRPRHSPLRGRPKMSCRAGATLHTPFLPSAARAAAFLVGPGTPLWLAPADTCLFILQSALHSVTQNIQTPGSDPGREPPHRRSGAGHRLSSLCLPPGHPAWGHSALASPCLEAEFGSRVGPGPRQPLCRGRQGQGHGRQQSTPSHDAAGQTSGPPDVPSGPHFRSWPEAAH